MLLEEKLSTALKFATDTKTIKIGKGVISETAPLFKEFFPRRKAMILTNKSMWEGIGEKIFDLLIKAEIPADKYLIENPHFHSEWKFVEMIDCIIEGNIQKAKHLEWAADYSLSEREKPVSSENSILIAIGGGTINDLCKLCSHHHSQQYISIPTASSVDGFSAFGASVIFQGLKQPFACPAPIAIIADTDILTSAPARMSAGGYADLLAKKCAGADWIVADFVAAEKINPTAWSVLQDHLDGLLQAASYISTNEPIGIKKLFNGLILSGIAMQVAKSSRPASCSEHVFSHILDMEDYSYNGKFPSHGFQVSIGIIAMAAFYEEFLKLDFKNLDVESCVSAWSSYPDEVRKGDDESTIKRELTLLKSNWDELQSKLKAYMYSFKKMQSLLKSAGAPHDPSVIGLSRAELRNMFPKVLSKRKRYGLLDLACRAQVFDLLLNRIFGSGGLLDVERDLLKESNS